MKTCMSEQKISIQNLDSLGIESSLCGDLGIADKINKKLYNNDKRRVVTPRQISRSNDSISKGYHFE